jgi:glycosyltransferase involved in cell wall biosynthesis
MAIEPLRIGFVSTRLAGTDGVSLEAAKWCKVFAELGHSCFYFAGESDRPADRTRVIPEAHFDHPLIRGINGDLFCENVVRSPETSDVIHELRSQLKKALREFVKDFDIQLLKVENALSLPMNIPLGLALTEFIAETNFPTIAHHHDFVWERSRYAVNGAEDYLHAAFPPSMSSICHVVINTYAASELARRTGMRSTVVPNVMDFDNPPPEPSDGEKEIREALGMTGDEVFLLQPTRVVPRKCIERSIELAHWLEMPATLVVSHSSGDEGSGYQNYLENYARTMGVRIRFASGLFTSEDKITESNKRFTLADAYFHADLVTYPSRVEGFGNAFLEAIYYRRPLLMGSYDIFKVDIQPKGFQVIAIDEYLTPEAVEAVREILEKPTSFQEITSHNYKLARQHYSFTALRKRLQILLGQYQSRRSLSSFWA